MKFEDCEDKIKGSWVKVSDVELSIPSIVYSYAEADVHIPYGATIMDIEEYTKYVQDKAIDQPDDLITDICTGNYIQFNESDVEAIRIAKEALEEKAEY